MNGVEKLLLILRGCPEISPTKRNQVRNICWNHFIVNFMYKIQFCWCFLTDRLVHPRVLKTSEPTYALESMLRINRMILFLGNLKFVF